MTDECFLLSRHGEPYVLIERSSPSMKTWITPTGEVETRRSSAMGWSVRDHGRPYIYHAQWATVRRLDLPSPVVLDLSDWERGRGPARRSVFDVLPDPVPTVRVDHRLAAMEQMRAAGQTLEAVGEYFGISHQRVGQILKRVPR